MKEDYHVLFTVELEVKSVSPVEDGFVWCHEESKNCAKFYESPLNIIRQQARPLLPDAIRSASEIITNDHLCIKNNKPILRLEIVVKIYNDEVIQLGYIDWLEDLRKKLLDIFERAIDTCDRIQANNPDHPERVLLKYGQGHDLENVVHCEDSDVLAVSERLRKCIKKTNSEQPISLMSSDGKRIEFTLPNETSITLESNEVREVNIVLRTLNLDSQECQVIDQDKNCRVKLNYGLADVGKLCSAIPHGSVVSCKVHEAYKYETGKRIPVRYVLQKINEIREDLIT